MPSSEYANTVLEYIQTKDWTTNLTELREGTYVIAGTRKKNSELEEMLLMIVCEPEDEVGSEHVEYLLKAGQQKNVNSVSLTHTLEISNDAQKLFEEYNVNLLTSKEVRSPTEPSGFDVDADDISIPKLHLDDESNLSDNTIINKGNAVNEKILEMEAKYTQSDARSVRGKLIFYENKFNFELSSIAKLRLGESVEVSYEEIQALDREENFSRGLKDIIFGRGWRDRLKIETNDGRELLFVVSDIDDTINKIRTLMKSDSVRHQSSVEYLPKQDNQSEEPTTLTLGRAAAWLVGAITLYVGIELLINQGHLSGLLYLMAGTIVMPYTRNHIESYVGMRFGRWFLLISWVGICLIAALMYAAVSARV